MSEVDHLLERAGLRHYAGLFEARQVDLDGLMNLTERDLAELGLSAVARQALLQEIRRLAPGRGAAAPLAPGNPPEAERRQLTLMFCDLVDSVGLSNKLDPEDLRDVIAAYQRACTASIRRYDGHVARYVGDGILAFFGYPSAHEDDAERAVRAGRDLIGAVTRLNDELDIPGGFMLRARIGIATGIVVVGDVTSGGVTEKDAVAGEAANLASRLQGLARPNSIVVSALTRTIAAEAFAYRDLGRQSVKGFDAPIAAFEIVAEREVSRLEARSTAQTPFVNRDREIAIMLRCWERAAAGEGQVLIISGEAGVGKSRVVAEGCARMWRLNSTGKTASPPPLRFQCAPYHANSALYPIVKQISTLAQIDQSDTDQDKFDKLDRFIDPNLPERDRALSLIAELLDVNPKGRYAPDTRSSQEKRRLTIEALVSWCASRLSEQTLIIVFEDFQWIDPTSRLLLRRLAGWIENVRALLIITERRDAGASAATALDEAQPAAAARTSPRLTRCEVTELTASDTGKLITAAAKGSAISAEEINDILGKSSGLPLYAEELTKSFLQTRTPVGPRHADRPRSFNVPHTISDALMARLDRLGGAKEIAQYASVIGQEFSLKLLERIAALPIEELTSHLRALIESDIVTQSDADDDVYRFKHALIRDISYHSLLNRNRNRSHLKIATELAQSSIEAAKASDDLVAQHYSLGGAYRQSIAFWQRGATAAIARSAHEEALGMLESAFNDLRRLRDPNVANLELDLTLAQVMALRWLRGYPSEEFHERLLRARDLCEATGSDEKRFDVEWGLFQYSIVRADFLAAHDIAAGLLEHAARHPDRPIVDAYLASGIVAFVRGEFEHARALFEKGLELSNPEADEPHFFTHGQNPGLFCLCYLAHTLCFLGYIDRARTAIERSLSIAQARAREPAHIYGYVNALTFAVRVYQYCDDISSERRLAEKIVDISRRNQYAYYEALSRCHLGWVIGAEGHLSEGIDQMIEGISTLERGGTLLALPGFHTLLAELYIRADRLPEANQVLARATSTEGLSTWDAEVERLRGDILALGHDAGAAEAAYRSSLEIAIRQGARSLMLKTGLKLSALLHGQGRKSAAREILERCVEQLPDDLNLPDARRALAAIASLTKDG